MGEINAVIRKASNIRTLSRELTGVKEEMSILTEKPKSETSEPFSFCDKGKIQRLKARAADIYRTLERDFDEASALTKRVEDKKGDFDFQLPFTRKKMLLVRQQSLVNEMKEATPFFEQSQTLYISIIQSNLNWHVSLLNDAFNSVSSESIFGFVDDIHYVGNDSDDDDFDLVLAKLVSLPDMHDLCDDI